MEEEMDQPLRSRDHLGSGGTGVRVDFQSANQTGVSRFCFFGWGEPAACGREGESLAARHGLLTVADIQGQDLKAVVCNGVVLTLLYMVIGGLWFMVSDGWTFTETVYFMTTSFLTIGYGDIVVNPDETDRLIDTLIILLGLMIVTLWATCATRALRTIRTRRDGLDPSEPALDANREFRKYRWMLLYRLILISVVILIGALVFMAGEGLGFTYGFYWAVVTASSIGYGDIVPTTPAMRWFTSFFSIVATVSMVETLRFAGAYPFKMWQLRAESKVFEQFTKAETASERTAAAALADTAVTEVLGIPSEARAGGAVGRSDMALAMLLLLNRVSLDDVRQANRIYDTLDRRDNVAIPVRTGVVGSKR